jgi:hypothetical protein
VSTRPRFASGVGISASMHCSLPGTGSHASCCAASGGGLMCGVAEGDAGCSVGGQSCFLLRFAGGAVVSGAQRRRVGEHLGGGRGVRCDGELGGSLEGEAQQADLAGGVGKSPQFAEPFFGGVEVASAQMAVRESCQCQAGGQPDAETLETGACTVEERPARA